MNRAEYLHRAYQRLGALVNDDLFRNNRAQIRAKAIQNELLLEPPEIAFQFDAKKIWKYCDYIFSEGALLLREEHEETEQILEWIKTAAETFEFLSKFAEEDEQEALLLSAAMCYHIAGYQANAQCLARLVQDQFLPTRVERNSHPDAVLTYFYRTALVDFLTRRIAHLRQLTKTAEVFIRSVQASLAQALAEQTESPLELYNLVGHAYFHRALSKVVQFALAGESSCYAEAEEALEQSHGYFQRTGDATLGTLTSELRTVLELFHERSTWATLEIYAPQLLEDKVWQTYLRSLAYDKSIVEFWPAQSRAIEEGLLSSNESYVVQMPTSAGKTFIAELAIASALTQDKRCLYIAPYRALVSEVERKLADTLGSIGYFVSTLVGGFEFDAFQDYLSSVADVLVTTPEKAELLLRTHPEFFEDVSVVVIDEGHILDEGVATPADLNGHSLVQDLERQGTLGRGPLLELLLTKLRSKLPDTRFIFLSAVMPHANASEFAEWLAGQGQEPLRLTERPSRLSLAKFEWKRGNRGRWNGRLEYISLPRLPDGTAPFVPYFLEREQYLTGGLTQTGRPQRQLWPSQTNKAQTTAMLATRFARTGPVLVFCAQTAHVQSVTDNIITSLQYLEASGLLPTEKLRYIEEPSTESYYVAQEWLGDDHLLTKALHYGVALHYGPLPDPVRQAVENDFKQDQVQILVSTNTLGQGVNLPIKTALIYSLERRYGARQASTIKKRDFWNICGRAGRAGKETEGQIIFVALTNTDHRLLRQFQDETNLEHINSALYQLLYALVQQRISEDDLIGYLDSHVLALLAEEVVDTSDEEQVREWLGKSLVGIQAAKGNVSLDPLVSAVNRASQWVVQNVPDQQKRKVFSSTGLRTRSCQRLEEIASQFTNRIDENYLAEEVSSTTLNEILLRHAFEACFELPEMRRAPTVPYFGPDDELSLIFDWMNGVPLRTLRHRHWEDDAESFSQYLADRIIYKLPWGFNGFLRILAHTLHLSYEDLPISWQHLPSMMKFGVNEVVACWASSFGVTSRGLALQLAVLHATEEVANYYDFIKWLVNIPTEFILNDLAGFDFEKRKLIRKLGSIEVDKTYLRIIRALEDTIELESTLQGIDYEDRAQLANRLREGDEIILESEPDNPYDAYAVRVLFDGHHIGYVQRDTAKIASRELQLGARARAMVSEVVESTLGSPSPHITLSITISR